MKFVSFEIDGGCGYGAVRGDGVVRLDLLPQFAPDLKSALSRGGLQDQAIPAGPLLDLARLELLPPIPDPGKIICVATNFHEPAREGKPVPEFPLVFTRFAESVTGSQRPLLKPSQSDMYDFEGELAVVIGKPGHRIPADAAMDHVAGYACFNDGSVRDWQRHSTQFTPGKNFYRSASMGPWLVTRDEVPDPASLRLRTLVNGELKQQISIAQMIFDIPWLVAYFSTFTPLQPGDVLVTGTPSGFGSSRTPPEFLSEGDVIEVEIEGIGTLRNAVQQV